METPILTIGNTVVTASQAMAGLGLLVLLLLVALLVALGRMSRQRALEAASHGERAQAADSHIADLTRAHAEMAGRLQAFAEALAQRQADLGRSVTERLDQVTQRVGENLTRGTAATTEQLQKLEARIAVLDAARDSITSLTDQVTGLKAILANKPARGAFGQGRMEAIVKDALPPSGYSFQTTLGTGVRPDCLIYLPGDARALAVDAKFPLEAFEQLRLASGPEMERVAEARVRSDIGKHIKDVSEKYLVPGETQDIALLFVPSESIYAELNERFEDVVQRSHKARVLVVSPSLLMLAIQVVQGLVRDAAMREQAHLIQDEVRKLLDDVRRLVDRTGKLKSHFGQVEQDLSDIDISAAKIQKRGSRIDQMEFSGSSAAPEALPNPIARSVAAE
ncbi:DNA recombination protein RmuC [Agaricicola taiwanensis]|nr:DNA recombination protein RmuC [Agaricicola taiwanensis]